MSGGSTVGGGGTVVSADALMLGLGPFCVEYAWFFLQLPSVLWAIVSNSQLPVVVCVTVDGCLCLHMALL